MSSVANYDFCLFARTNGETKIGDSICCSSCLKPLNECDDDCSFFKQKRAARFVLTRLAHTVLLEDSDFSLSASSSEYHKDFVRLIESGYQPFSKGIDQAVYFLLCNSTVKTASALEEFGVSEETLRSVPLPLAALVITSFISYIEVRFWKVGMIKPRHDFLYGGFAYILEKDQATPWLEASNINSDRVFCIERFYHPKLKFVSEILKTGYVSNSFGYRLKMLARAKRTEVGPLFKSIAKSTPGCRPRLHHWITYEGQDKDADFAFKPLERAPRHLSVSEIVFPPKHSPSDSPPNKRRRPFGINLDGHSLCGIFSRYDRSPPPSSPPPLIPLGSPPLAEDWSSPLLTAQLPPISSCPANSGAPSGPL